MLLFPACKKDISEIPVQSVSLVKDTTVVEGTIFRLAVTISPSNATNQSVRLQGKGNEFAGPGHLRFPGSDVRNFGSKRYASVDGHSEAGRCDRQGSHLEVRRPLWYPAAGWVYAKNGSFYYQNCGNWWSCTPESGDFGAHYLYMRNSEVKPAAVSARAAAYSVRCTKE